MLSRVFKYNDLFLGIAALAILVTALLPAMDNGYITQNEALIVIGPVAFSLIFWCVFRTLGLMALKITAAAWAIGTVLFALKLI